MDRWLPEAMPGLPVVLRLMKSSRVQSGEQVLYLHRRRIFRTAGCDWNAAARDGPQKPRYGVGTGSLRAAATPDLQLRDRPGQRRGDGGNLFVRQLFLQPGCGTLARFLRLGLVDALGRYRHVGDDRDGSAGDLDEPLADGEKRLAGALPQDDFARDDSRHQRHVQRVDADLKIGRASCR